jgi:hypothetical protein
MKNVIRSLGSQSIVLIRLALFCLLFCFAIPSPAFVQGSTGAHQPKGFSAFLGAGPNLIFPYSVRVGWNAWELGILNGDFKGINRVFFLNKTAYAGLALGVDANAFPGSLGFQGSLGVRWKLLGELGIRAEMAASTHFNGNTKVNGLLGFSYGL